MHRRDVGVRGRQGPFALQHRQAEEPPDTLAPSTLLLCSLVALKRLYERMHHSTCAKHSLGVVLDLPGKPLV
ncbi:hypothetical protein cyc_06051 [Cyclospora cayetanensis]|uniref:Uncharacterized protein n=1 Tax=Cyclospora cayetanensis TaxID=88456 RepID=A0A1D3CQV9_9EIME|nr:hypothetical protein cyc_06051 [Cyclospora cayetanensis]